MYAQHSHLRQWVSTHKVDWNPRPPTISISGRLSCKKYAAEGYVAELRYADYSSKDIQTGSLC